MTYPGNGAPPTYPAGPAMPQAPASPRPATGPPALLALQGQLQNPAPLLVAAAGLMLVCLAFFLPQAGYSHGSGRDPLQEYFFLPGRSSELYLSLADNQAVVPLVLAVAITIALAGSRRWLLFGRLACFGLALVGVATAVGGAFAWQQSLRDLIAGTDDYREAMSGEESEAASKAAEKTDIDFGAGLWLLVAGLIVLAVAVMLIKVAPRVHRPHPAQAGRSRSYDPYPVHPPAMPPRPAAATAYPAAPAPAPAPETGGDRDVSVHDDPPSLSIYKPPRKET